MNTKALVLIFALVVVAAGVYLYASDKFHFPIVEKTDPVVSVQ
jgi:hypothetical protein